MQENSVPDRFVPIPDPRPSDEPWPQMSWPVAPGTTLTGKFVELNPLDPAADAAELFGALDHDAVWAHVPGRPRDAEHFAEILVARGAMPDWHLWTVRTRVPVGDTPAGAIVGVSGYLDANQHDARLEIGYTLYRPSVWAGVVNPEAKLLLLEYAFDTLGAGRVQLKTDTRNHRSQQAIARLGARYEGTLRRHFRREDGTIRDSVMFAVTVDDWPVVRRGLQARLDA